MKRDLSLHGHFMQEALKEAQKAFERGEVPVGAVVVFENKIIARAHNQSEMLHDPTAHAEMIAITQAAEYVAARGGKSHRGDSAPEAHQPLAELEHRPGAWSDRPGGLHRGSLEKASIYVTMEPCMMCAGALVISKCERLIYGVSDPKGGACGSLYNLISDDRLPHQVKLVKGILADEAKGLLQEFFKNLRKDKR